MHAITPENVLKVIEKVERRSFLANPFYLILNCQYEETPDDIIVFVDKNRLIFPSRRPQNIVNKEIWCFKEDIDHLKSLGLQIKKIAPDAFEYFYNTQDYIDLKGRKFATARAELNYFTKHYNYQVLEKYPRDKTKKFIDSWFAQKKFKKKGMALETLESEYNSSLQIVDLLDRVQTGKSIYVLVDGKLAGMAIFASMYPDFWAGVVQKVDPQYKGIGKMLYVEQAKVMTQCKIFTTGDDAMDAALAVYKMQLKPAFTKQHFLVETGGLLS